MKQPKRKVKFRTQIVYVAFNPETGYCMWPTATLNRKGTIWNRNKFYKGCPVVKCELRPLTRRERG